MQDPSNISSSAEAQIEGQNPSKGKWKNLGIRAVSALFMVGVCIMPFYYGGVFWGALIGVIGLRMVYEWVRMSEEGSSFLRYIIPMVGILATLALTYMGQPQNAILAALITAILALFERMQRGGGVWAGLGFLYIALPTALIILMRGDIIGPASNGFKSLIYIILVVIAADTGAYFGGSYFKGPKLAPNLSPNKTWSGFFSGIVAGIIIAAISAIFIGVPSLNTAIFAVPLIICSVLGDLIESALKRKLQVKDAGGILPGHGGVLDRVDSLMLAVIFAYIVMVYLPQYWPIS